MTEFEEILRTGNFAGIVEDNQDPDKKQRVRVRVPYLHGTAEQIPTDALPWAQPKRDLAGTSFQVPAVSKVVNVTYPHGNQYYPTYDQSEHLDINLQRKAEEYSGEDYVKFQALLYDHNSQVYVDNRLGLFVRHKFNEINLDSDSITQQLHTNDSTLYLGDSSASQDAVLGTNFFRWMDTFVQTMLNAYIGNLGAPAVANPALINVVSQYFQQREDFLSEHVKVVNNFAVSNNKFKVEDQQGDEFATSSVKKVTKVKTAKLGDFTPPPPSEQLPPVNNQNIPMSTQPTENAPNLGPRSTTGQYTDLVNFNQANDKKMSHQDVANLAQEFGLEPAAVWSILKNETGGRGGFYSSGKDVDKPRILFEGHIFYQLMQKKGKLASVTDNSMNIIYKSWNDRGNAYNLNQYDRLNAAIQYDLQAALQSASWGVGQLMGNNYGSCGYKDVEEMVRYMYYSEKEQFRAMLRFIAKNKKMAGHLNEKNWAGFARAYNGPGYAANKYDVKLATTYDANKGRSDNFV